MLQKVKDIFLEISGKMQMTLKENQDRQLNGGQKIQSHLQQQQQQQQNLKLHQHPQTSKLHRKRLKTTKIFHQYLSQEKANQKSQTRPTQN